MGIFEKLRAFIKDQRDMRKLGDGEIHYPGVGIITDEDVYKYVKKHTHWWDRLDPEFVARATLLSQTFMVGYGNPPQKEKWKFPEDVWDDEKHEINFW